MIVSNLIPLLGCPINDELVQEFINKYNIPYPERDLVFASGHNQIDFLNIDAKQECGLLLLFQTTVWNSNFIVGTYGQKVEEYHPLLTTIIVYNQDNGFKEPPLDLQYGMSASDITEKLGSPCNPYISPFCDTFEQPKHWSISLDEEKEIDCHIQIFEGQTLDNVILTINTNKPIMYVLHRQHYRQMERSIFVEWAIRNSYFLFNSPYDTYKKELLEASEKKTNEVSTVADLLEEKLAVSAVYLKDFDPKIHAFILNYFMDDFPQESSWSYENDFRECDCEIIEFYDDEESTTEKKRNHEKLFQLISKRLEDFMKNRNSH